LIESKIPKISSIKIVHIESKMMGGGRMGKKSSSSRASSSSFMLNGDVRDWRWM